ncbi:MAG: flagellar biosynthesis protein FlhA [Treponema sp.]|nr:flagellar biosynthesis protein FlhA [Treponema sp.]
MADGNRVVDRILNFVKQSYMGVFAIFVILFMILPVPKVLVDVMMILNLSLCIIVLLTVITIPRAADFESFPRVILFQTMFGLGLNISSTRLILTGDIVMHGNRVDMPGQSNMVQAFAKIVTGNNIVIGFVIFIILIIVQVVVITKGATRISEVSARFTLDSMQPKLFDVDNRLNSGAISDEEAQELKAQIRREIDFYSTMDGASKFVSGNVKAGIVITVVNLLGGFIIGMVMKGMDFSRALSSYSSLTIGDGLLSQLPSMMISFATGILVTGTKTDDNLAQQVINDFSRAGGNYEILGAVLVVLGVALGLLSKDFTLLFMLVIFGGLFIFVGNRMNKSNAKKEEKKKELAQKDTKAGTPSQAQRQEYPLLDPLSIELGFALIPLVDEEKGAELTGRISNIRMEAANDMGLIVPNIHIQDNIMLEPNEYVFKIHGIEAGRATIKLGYYMAINTSGMPLEEIQGEKTTDPTFGLSAVWVNEEKRQEAEEAGYTICDPSTVMATHITELIRSNADIILGSEEVKKMMDRAAEKYPVLVQEVLDNAKMSYGQIERILKNLLSERVSIRGIETILSAISDYAGVSKDTWFLTQKVREALGLQIAKQYVDKNNKLYVMILSQELSELVANHAFYPKDGSKPMVAFDPVDGRRWKSCISAALTQFQNMVPIILCAPEVRQLVYSLCEMEMNGVVVLSTNEVFNAGKKIHLEVIGEISDRNGDM